MAMVECAHTSTQDYACKRGKGQRKWNYREGVAGIQLTGTSFQYHLEGDYPVCRDKRREEGQLKKQKDQQVRSQRQGFDLFLV